LWQIGKPQAHDCQSSFHLGVFQGIDFHRERECSTKNQVCPKATRCLG
jgi:hypothetical protein